MKTFLQQVADILEVESVTPDTRFREIPYWDSLKGFGLLVLMENDYGHPLTIDRFLTLDTVGDLARHAGLTA